MKMKSMSKTRWQTSLQGYDITGTLVIGAQFPYFIFLKSKKKKYTRMSLKVTSHNLHLTVLYYFYLLKSSEKIFENGINVLITTDGGETCLQNYLPYLVSIHLTVRSANF